MSAPERARARYPERDVSAVVDGIGARVHEDGNEVRGEVVVHPEDENAGPGGDGEACLIGDLEQ